MLTKRSYLSIRLRIEHVSLLRVNDVSTATDHVLGWVVEPSSVDGGMAGGTRAARIGEAMTSNN
jgi:hypothetical protein